MKKQLQHNYQNKRPNTCLVSSIIKCLKVLATHGRSCASQQSCKRTDLFQTVEPRTEFEWQTQFFLGYLAYTAAFFTKGRAQSTGEMDDDVMIHFRLIFLLAFFVRNS